MANQVGDPPVVCVHDDYIEIEWCAKGQDYSLVHSLQLTVEGARELAARLVTATDRMIRPGELHGTNWDGEAF